MNLGSMWDSLMKKKTEAENLVLVSLYDAQRLIH
jgi:hypothetical protein